MKDSQIRAQLLKNGAVKSTVPVLPQAKKRDYFAAIEARRMELNHGR